jgi:hypothetical protein
LKDMRTIQEIKESCRLRIEAEGDDGLAATLIYPMIKPGAIFIVASWGGGWEHVSISLKRRCQNWDEMCLIKDIF